MTRRQPTPIRRRKLATELKNLRGKKTQAEVEEWTGLDQSVISKIENARQPIEKKHVRLLTQCYGVDAPEVDRLLRMADEAEERGLLVEHSDTMPRYAADYFEMEYGCRKLLVHACGWVFGLLQTPAYIRAVRLIFKPDATEEEIQASIGLRVARQSILDSDEPPFLHVIMDVAVLLRLVGSRAIMAEQVQFLIELSKRPNIRIQLVERPSRSTGKEYTVMHFDNDAAEKTVYVENIRSSSWYEKPTDIQYHEELFDELAGDVALSAEDTRERLTRLQEYWEQPEEG